MSTPSNDNLARIQTIDAQIAAIKKILSRGEYVGAGVSLSLRVGPDVEGAGPALDLELSEGLEPLLNGMISSLEVSRSFRVGYARKDLTELQKFFGEQNG